MSVYAPLARWLEKQPARTEAFTTTFRILEGILKRPLPPSARKYQAWWSNDESHSQARAWMEAGWRVAGVDLATMRVTFQRETSVRRAGTVRPAASPSPAPKATGPDGTLA